jgi:hypothetical protein
LTIPLGVAPDAVRNGAKGGRARSVAPENATWLSSFTQGVAMKLRLFRTMYVLASVVTFVVAAGAGNKFH